MCEEKSKFKELFIIKTDEGTFLHKGFKVIKLKSKNNIEKTEVEEKC